MAGGGVISMVAVGVCAVAMGREGSKRGRVSVVPTRWCGRGNDVCGGKGDATAKGEWCVVGL